MSEELREIINWTVEIKPKFKKPHRFRQLINILIEFIPKSEMRNCEREIENFSKGEMSEIRRKMVYWLVEKFSGREVGGSRQAG